VTFEPEGDAAAALFGECCGLVIVSCAPENEERLGKACDSAGVPIERIGTLGGAAIAVRCGALALEVAPDDARAAYEGTLPRAMAAG
jgi:phosphoribosylformylglycinamidine synthase subunit PurL